MKADLEESKDMMNDSQNNSSNNNTVLSSGGTTMNNMSSLSNSKLRRFSTKNVSTF